jgi:palmitoyltransferase ZDHHC9/14/18
MGNCVGKKNYRFFYSLIISVSLNILLQIFSSISFIIIQYKGKKSKSKNNVYVVVLLSLVIFVNLMILIFFLFKLLILHSYLLFTGTTFYEYYKKKYDNPLKLNPFNQGCYRNFYNIFCRKRSKGKIDLTQERVDFKIEDNLKITTFYNNNDNNNETNAIDNNNNKKNEKEEREKKKEIITKLNDSENEKND